jgi:hypothetical protein
MSARWPGWEDHPGLDIAPIAAYAATQPDGTAGVRIVVGPDGARGRADCFGIKVDADGNCSVPNNEQWWEPMIEDGKLTGVRAVGRDPAEYPPWRLIRAPVIAIPAAQSTVVIHAYVPETIPLEQAVTDPAAVADCCCSPESGVAAMSLMIDDQTGHVTVASWLLTAESALALAAAMTAQHGPPVAEWLGTSEHRDVLRKALEGHGVLIAAGDDAP